MVSDTDRDADATDSDGDVADAPTATDGDVSAARHAENSPREAGGARDVVVPIRVYKTVTVFSTLIAVVCVVLGFALLDAATVQLSFLRRFVAGTLTRVGAGVSPGVLSTALALAGLAVIGFGAGVYVFGTRFRARGMGKSQEDSTEGTDNG